MADPRYAVRFVATEREIPAALWEQCFPPPLEGAWWYRALEASGLEHQFDFFYALLLHDGVPLGIAPLFTMHIEVEFLIPQWLIPFLAWLGKMLPSLSAPRALMIGCPCADEGTVGLLPGTDRGAALAALQHAIEAEAERRGAALVVWKDFPASWDADLRRLAADNDLFRMVSFPGTVLTLPDGDKDAYYASLTSTRRYNLKKKLKRSAREFDPLVEAIQNPDEATLDELYALFEQTRGRARTSFEDLGRRFFVEIAKAPVSHFIILRERETRRAVAFKLCFLSEGHLINKYIGLDYTRPRDWFLYFRLTDVTIDFAVAHGARAIQSGQTGYSAKIEQGHQLYPLTNYGKYRNAAFNGICKWVTARIGWATLDDDLAVYVKAHPDTDAASR